MKRLAIFAYGLACYAVFFATFLYAVGFIGNFWVPKAIDSPREVSMGTALLVDLGLLALFAVQHSVMARPEPRVLAPVSQRVPQSDIPAGDGSRCRAAASSRRRAPCATPGCR